MEGNRLFVVRRVNVICGNCMELIINDLPQHGILIHGPVNPKERRDQRKAQIATSEKWTVEVDGVLFSDGVFVGPDTRMWFDTFEAQNRAATDLIAELNRKLDDGEDAFAHAEQCASVTIEQIQALYYDLSSHPRHLEYSSALTKKSTAMNVVVRWKKFGEQATVEWIRESAKSQIPLVRR
jgi:hypothetical protein